MKKALILSILTALSLSCNAVNYFQNGMQMEWKRHAAIPPVSDAPGNPAEPQYVTLYLDGEDFVAGKECLRLYSAPTGCNETQSLLTYIHTNGDKVYFLSIKPDSDPNEGEWLLLYDFGLTAGDITSIALLNWENALCVHNDITITCTGLTQEQSPTGTLTKIQITENNADTGEWIAGIGCLQGYTLNGGWGLDGAGASILLKASLNGEILYRNENADIEAPIGPTHSATDAPRYKPDGTAFLPSDKGIYIQNGAKHIAR